MKTWTKMIKFKCSFLIGLFFMAALLLFPLDPHKKLTQYIHKKWGTDDGLPNNYISAVLQTGDGYLWVGTYEGLVRFDGVTFTVFNKDNNSEIKDNRITVLFESSEQTLWVGTRGGLTLIKNGEFKSWIKGTKNNGLLHHVVQTVQEDWQGNVWIGYQGKGISFFKKRNVRYPLHPAELSRIPDINVIARDKYYPEILWIGTASGLFLLKNGKLTEVPMKTQDGTPLTPIGAIRTLISNKKGNILVGTDKSGLIHVKYREATSQLAGYSYTYRKQPGLKSDWINVVFVDRDENTWVGTEGGGLHRLYADSISVFAEKDGLSNDAVNCIHEDREGNLWVGTYSGLDLLMNGKFTSYTEKEGLLDNGTWTLYEDSQKRLWITTNEGLNCFQEGRFTSFTIKDGLSSSLVSSTWEDKKGNLWIGTYDKGLNCLKNGRFGYCGKDYGLYEQSVRVVYVDSRANLWVGTYGQGLFKLPDNQHTFTSISTKNGLSSDHIFVIFEDHKGGLWIGTDGGGLNYLKDNHIYLFTQANGLSSNAIFSIYEDMEENQDKKGALWIGTEDGGLNYFKDGTIVPITRQQGLRDNTIYQIIEDDNGFLWMSGHKGISRVRKQELYDFLEGKILRVTPALFGKADGMKVDECSGGFQPAGCKTSQGKIWFPTPHGIVGVDPDDIKINTLAPPVHIEKVVVNGKPAQGVEPLSLEPHVKKIAIHYTALSLSEPRNVKFKYIMEGFEDHWVNSQNRKDRIAIYTNLPPGQYRFRLTACNNDGIWNEDGVSLDISVLYPFWQQWWFILIAVIGFAIISYLALSGLKNLIKMADFWRKKNYIGAYRIVEQIGVGGMANILKVVSGKRSKKEFLALKLIKEEFIFDEVYRKRFLDEGQIIDHLQHPHIVKVFDRGEHNHNLFIAMELLEGQTLEQVIQQTGGLSPGESLDIVLQILDALSVIHDAGIVHRDLKPGNIMLVKKKEKENFVKILDFGLAKTQSLSRVTESGMVVGTLSYLSPEQLFNSEYSFASDIYSLGTIFYEMLTGEKAYNGETPLEVMQQMFKTKPRPPKALKPDIPHQLNSIVLKMMEKQPGNRPSAETLKTALKKIKASGGQGLFLKKPPLDPAKIFD
jgi:ligand-binding sensor domain-containing protein/tRNA A-37 threonylcarbamoyl transferase component Bud32